ncbi:DUF134 domain-containing protein [Clostridiisalibacter paucivorans]|uniref:DUF134 domain-containing protein n=1 Tax=Clostridiisalibacter paucivorans TaxID=408753 RepID=UPI00047A6544|nr:DUF134 domain-containing protein [Clostridiisalibacter paucivorans]
MARPVKWRRVENLPQYKYFKPANIPACELEENVLKVEELEAIRLRDLEALDQESCAEKMKVSRQTFQRIYNDAKKKVADSLINGKAISIKGGNYTRNICVLVCEKCGYQWENRVEDLGKYEQEKSSCPQCGSENTTCHEPKTGRFCGRRCRHRGI